MAERKRPGNVGCVVSVKTFRASPASRARGLFGSCRGWSRVLGPSMGHVARRPLNSRLESNDEDEEEEAKEGKGGQLL